MDKKLHLLDSFAARGPDGQVHKVCCYEHMVRDASLPPDMDRWESTGLAEYRLADGSRVEMLSDGSFRKIESRVPA
ncbi:MAG TPA: hypothetical protein VF169_23070 [Albitalea sp.]|uniref:hypothetical protein n=1 Tax=Piscinibacter sp. TaxID=1903157 RepID=UPI002ECFF070